MTATAVHAEGLTKRFGRHPALQGIDLSISQGQVFGVIGPNGAGKTTTMRLMLGILRPTSGTLRVLGEDPATGGPALRRRIGYLPGELRLASRVRGGDLLRHFGNISGGVPESRIRELADRLGLDLSRPVRTLSRGNKQKIGLVQAFMHHPELLVLDEPTSGLDPLIQQQVHGLISEAAAEGQTVFLSSHVLSEVQEAATDVAILRSGRIVRVSSVAALRGSAKRRFRAEITDASPAVITEALGTLAGVTALRLEPAMGGAAASERPIDATMLLSGDPDSLLKALARFRVTDITVEEPDLEQAVLSLYSSHGTDAQSPAVLSPSAHAGPDDRAQR